MSGTAHVHPEATLTPGKLDLLATWLPRQSWYQDASGAALQRAASFRFVDPDGEVGLETLLVRSAGVTYQVPLTYRGEPLDGGQDYLVGEMEHSVLGHRWVYDATGDPVYVAELIRVIREGDEQAALSSGAAASMTVRGSGVVLVSNSSGQVRIQRVLHPAPDVHTFGAVGTLEGSWNDGEERTATLAALY